MPAGTPAVPVAIVGAGACGLTAALFLRERGIDCVLLERDATPQGSTALSSGFIPAAGTAVQRAAGVRRQRGAALHGDIQRKAHDTAAPHLVAAYTQAIAPALDGLARHGLQFELLDGFLYPGHTARRMHTLPQRTGAALVGALASAAEAAGAMLVTHALVRALWTDGTTACWAWATRAPTARWSTWPATRCCWPATASAATRAHGATSLLPAMRDAVFAGHTGNDGSAIAWARQLGRGWPIWAATRATARGPCRRARS